MEIAENYCKNLNDDYELTSSRKGFKRLIFILFSKTLFLNIIAMKFELKKKQILDRRDKADAGEHDESRGGA
jgi:hypothetical protein